MRRPRRMEAREIVADQIASGEQVDPALLPDVSDGKQIALTGEGGRPKGSKSPPNASAKKINERVQFLCTHNKYA